MTLEEFISSYGLTTGLAIWIIIGLIRLATKHIPDAIAFFQEHVRDKREFSQEIEKTDRQFRYQSEAEQRRMEELQQLNAQGAKTFLEEQITQMTSEVFVDSREANEFVRREVQETLKVIINILTLIKDRQDRIPKSVAELLRPELEENSRLRTNIALIAELLQDYERGRRTQQPKKSNPRQRSNLDTRAGSSGDESDT